MRHYPIYLDLAGKKVVFSGAGETAAAKIRLLLKTEAEIVVAGRAPCTAVREWAAGGRLRLHERFVTAEDAGGAALFYAANADRAMDGEAAAIGRAAGALVNIVDNLADSAFLTPALVDRDPVTVAIGTEGTAPVLARELKAKIEALLPASTGRLARLANAFRPVAATLATGRQRRVLWSRYFSGEGENALALGGEGAVRTRLASLFAETRSAVTETGSIALVGAGPGDPELLTLKARRLLHDADLVLHDQLVTDAVLELARREAKRVHVGKKGFGKSWRQADINALMIRHARAGLRVVRLKSGDPAIFGRLDEEIEALAAAGIDWQIVPGITAASAASATIGASLTRRGRNASLRFLTGHDVDGFAEQDWAGLAKPGAAAAIYMGLTASTFIRGRLMMHGADADTPVTIVWNASRPDQQVVAARLANFPEIAGAAKAEGPAILIYGLSPRRAMAALAEGGGEAQIAMTGTG